MRERLAPEELDERTRKILMAVIHSFIHTGEPVGSRTISKRFDFGLSPATIRNIMSDLEELGFLEHPHTSAGRMPTDQGYRFYVDNLREIDALSQEDFLRISQHYAPYHGEVDEVMAATSRLLSEISRYAGIVLYIFSITLFKRVEFVIIRGRQVLAIFVMESGMVHNKLIMLEEEISQDELHQIANYLNQEFSGQPLHTIRQYVLDRITEEKAQYAHLEQQALSVGAKTFAETAEGESDIYLGGTANIMDQPEFVANLEQMKELFKAFEEKNRLISLLDKCLDASGVHVILGSETPFKDMRECSFVTHTYSYDNHTLGVLGVVGPKRMVYPRIMALVDHTATIVSQILSQG